MIAIAEQRTPLIVVCAPEHPDVLRAQLARYEHEYDVRYTASSAETVELLTGLDDDQAVALLVAETEVPDDPGPARHVRLAGRGAHGQAGDRRPRRPLPRAGRGAAPRAWPPASTTPTC